MKLLLQLNLYPGTYYIFGDNNGIYVKLVYEKQGLKHP